MQLDPREIKLVLLALDAAAAIGERDSAALAFMRSLGKRFRDGHALVTALEARGKEIIRERVVLKKAESPYADVLMRFGKHKGKPLREVPADYLCWVLRKCDRLSPSTRIAIKSYLDFSPS
jgi:putative quorum-sensing-regulated virulence factor